jgi:putative tryptophan/tyrosine transport system substrate-binding protein
MRRREFMSLLGTVTLGRVIACPRIAGAQQRSKLPTIGFLGPTTPAPQWVEAFLLRLHELGWTEGRNVAIEYRWAENRPDRFGEIANELVQLKVDVIVTSGTPAVLAVKRATETIPIVFATAGDPVGTGLVASLARPGGNVTGFSLMSADVVGKRLELLREIAPGFGRLAVMTNVGFPDAVREMIEVQTMARTLGIEIVPLEIRRPDDIVSSFEMAKGRADALYVCGDPLMFNNRVRINALALGAALPTMHSLKDHVEAGGLISYGTNFADMFRQAAGHVDKILRGTKPADVPVEQPTRFELIVNLNTAKALGIVMPAALLARADAVIE